MATIFTLSNHVKEMKDALKDEPYAVDGFEFVLDDPSIQSEPLLEPLRGMSIPDGFTFVMQGVNGEMEYGYQKEIARG